jgi:hypothetical protein
MNEKTVKTNKILISAIEEVFQYASHINDWVSIKKEILKIIPVEERELFSTRDPKTKKQRTNDLERKLAQFWSSKTKKPIEMPDE